MFCWSMYVHDLFCYDLRCVTWQKTLKFRFKTVKKEDSKLVASVIIL